MKRGATPRTEAAVAEPPKQSREQRYRQAAELLREWKDDETGYDDEIWPLVEEDLAAMDSPERLATLRRQKGLTQQALADLAGIHMMQVHRYENGASLPSIDALKKLAVALRVSADQLLFDEDERTPADELKLQVEARARLDPDERRVIQEVVESMLVKHEARRWLRAGAQE